MRAAWLGLGILGAVSGCARALPSLDNPCAAWESPGEYRFVVERDDSKNRRALVHIPPHAGPRDVVVVLHGGAQNARSFRDVTSFTRLADQQGFVVVSPVGLGWPARSWNAGACCGTTSEDRRAIDDVGYLDAMIEELLPRVCGDRVLVTGFSNGAMLAHRWGCEGDQVDAIAPVAGPLTFDTSCEGDPLPIRYYHGTADIRVPAEGGEGGGVEAHDYPSVDETMAVWRRRNQCAPGPPEEQAWGADTTCARWDCAASTERCLVEGWGHAWPGGIHRGRTDAQATGAIWSWFQSLP